MVPYSLFGEERNTAALRPCGIMYKEVGKAVPINSSGVVAML